MQDTTQIKVWDPLVRWFHWTLVLAFTIAYVTEDEWLNLHVLAGYYIGGLLLLRVVWGLVGTRYARFSNFLYAPAKVKAYLRGLLHGSAEHYLGHNPAGGYMVLALLLMLALTVLTGMLAYGMEEAAGPLVGLVAGWHGEWGEELHEFAANTTLLLVFVHVAGVAVSSLLHKENLVRAMWTGKKPGGQS